MTLALAIDRDRVQSQDVGYDGDVVGSKIPDDIDIWLEKSQIQPDARDIENFAQITPFDDLLDLIDRCGVLKGVTHHEDFPLFFGQTDQIQTGLRRMT